jgi:hypothetical protein
MASSGMLCHVALVSKDVLEEFSASIIRVTRTGELGTKLAVTSMLDPSKTLVLTRATWHDVPEDSILHRHCHENLKSYIAMFLYMPYFSSGPLNEGIRIFNTLPSDLISLGEA